MLTASTVPEEATCRAFGAVLEDARVWQTLRRGPGTSALNVGSPTSVDRALPAQEEKT